MLRKSGRSSERSQKAKRRNGMLRLLMSLRLVRSQMKRSGKMDGLAYIVALLVAVRTYRAEKRKQRGANGGERTTLREVLGG